jgi:glycopeptide antibiotics resistance protein
LILTFSPFPLLAGAALLIAWLAVRWRRRRDLPELFCTMAFGVYLLVLVGVSLFPIPLPDDFRAPLTGRQWLFVVAHVNLVPFYFGHLPNARVLFLEVLDNLLMTVPFGFGLTFVTRVRARDFAWLALALGLAIETSQLVISLGLAGVYRSVDINDVLLNTAGVLVGYGLFKLFARGILSLSRNAALKPAGLAAYLREVASRAAS